MPKRAWENFIADHKAPIGFAAAISAQLPKGSVFDKNKRRLPTPYGLFIEWCNAYLAGEWAITKVPGGFIVCVQSPADAQMIISEFKAIGAPKKTPACVNTTPIGYKNSQYVALAGDLGYVV